MRLFALLLAAGCIAFGQSSPMKTGSVEGLWIGTLDVGSAKLRLAFHLQADGSGTMDSLDQNAKGIPVEKGSIEGTAVHLKVPAVHGSYDGELIDGGQKLQGLWKQGQPMPLVLLRSASLPEAKRPQLPRPPFPYRDEDVTFPSINASVKLAGTLTLPPGKGPFPAVVMITGSGPQDRNETIMDHKPFLVIADYLARRGVAVLRVDDRGVGKSTGVFNASTSADFADDTEGAVRYLRSRKETSSIGLIGHSEGAVIAPIVANRNPEVAFVVLLAGPAVPFDQCLLEQNRGIMAAMGLPESFVSSQVGRLEKILSAVRSNPDPKVAAEKARALIGDIDPALRPTVDAQIAQTSSAWFRWFLTYDPGAALQKLKQPVLAMNGSLDLQVVASQNVPVMKERLARNADHRVEILPGLNHLFQHAKTGAPSEYSSIEETFAPEALSMLGDWIAQHTGKVV